MTSTPANPTKKTALLLILDGWGHREETEHNAISAANTPTWDKLWQDCPHTLITTSGTEVGLPKGQMGNSEVGHMNLGAGRIVYQNLTRIDKAIEDGSFFENPALTNCVDKAIQGGKAVHILGLASPGGIHSQEEQLLAMIDLAHTRGAKRVYFHAFLDGRDTPPRSALTSLQRLQSKLSEGAEGGVASIIGRYFAMDRDNRWDRVEQAYNLITQARAQFTAADVESGLAAAYARDENDEFVKATSIVPPGTKPVAAEDGDAIVFMNFRSDRARQLTRAFTDPNFSGFTRAAEPRLSSFVTLTEYAADIDAQCAYPPQLMKNVLGEYLESINKTQLRIAETEKYAHVTFFFSGGREEPFKGETRTLIPSPQVATYDLQPEMSAAEVTDKLVAAIKSGEFDAIICNYANGDMVGHTGSFDAAIKAVETLDACLERITAAIRETDSQCLITADHGNVEQMVDGNTGQALTSHTSGPVPLVYVGNSAWSFKAPGSLCDIAPTLLELMGLRIPTEMTGQPLMQRG
jgi:2,3-bisphosphoglycerate-independent phosphoglycerate mutase